MDAGIKMDGVLLDDDLLLDQGVDLRLEEVALVDVIGLQLKVIFLQVGDVFDRFESFLRFRLQALDRAPDSKPRPDWVVRGSNAHAL